jgi:hypothetical protein
MRLLLARHFWGADLSAGLAASATAWRAAGYRAFEVCLDHVAMRDLAVFHDLRRTEDWGWIAGVYTDAFRTTGNVAAHLASLRAQLEALAACPGPAPLLVNSHSGLDRWSLPEMEDFFGGALELERLFGLPIAHETHRRRALATPWAAAAVLARFPTLQLTADLSHWVCVCERLLEDFEPLLDQVARQTLHVHARVGHEHGPQVPDPRAPEWSAQLAAHERWWDRIWSAQRARGLAVSTLTPEFGPPNYLWTQPHTRAPLADLAAVCDWMATRQSTRFAAA